MKNPNASNVVISEYHPSAIGAITALHGQYYHTQWNFGLYFESKVAVELAGLLTHKDARRNGFWVASVDEGIVGGIAIDGNQTNRSSARLRFLIVSTDCQGMGIGNRLMDTALSFCRSAGFKKIYLTTFEGLEAAASLYKKYGFELTREKEDSTWGITVKEQRFEKTL